MEWGGSEEIKKREGWRGTFSHRGRVGIETLTLVEQVKGMGGRRTNASRVGGKDNTK